MGASLLSSVGFEWTGHPHRLHTMRVDAALDGGIELVGGPWTTGDRSSDEIVSHTSWVEHEQLNADVVPLGSQQARGPGQVEVRWPVSDVGSRAVVAVTSLAIESLSHPAGFNVAALGVGIDRDGPQAEAWLRLEAAKVPERPERYESIEVMAGMTVTVVSSDQEGSDLHRALLAAQGRTKGGFRPPHRPFVMTPPAGRVLGLAGWSWSVTNTPRARGRYLRGFRAAANPDEVSLLVSNRGEITRPTDLDLGVDVILDR